MNRERVVVRQQITSGCSYLRLVTSGYESDKGETKEWEGHLECFREDGSWLERGSSPMREILLRLRVVIPLNSHSASEAAAAVNLHYSLNVGEFMEYKRYLFIVPSQAGVPILKS
ncbi:hypothetical protein NPIL_544271 [Nephila pilipes]|uniref:Uncharacterized protein n=1 Tax=Nephila pilipes TaxID=299642 RepID=A0A8X6PM12_NEPPI|nr:hypothetical protein NPIL_544271 [Nephila pilipes]